MARPKTPVSVLLKRGSAVGKRKLKEASEAKKPAIKANKAFKHLSDEDILRVTKLIPNYDPYRGADDYYLDTDAARIAIEFFPKELIHVKGSLTGKPFNLEEWQQGVIGNLFGWKSKETGLRRFNQCFIEIARKNGKTPLAAGIILYLFLMDGEPGSECYGAASEYKQASLVFTWAWGMVNANPTFREKVKVFRGQAKSMEKGQPGEVDYGIYSVICSDSLSAHGQNTHGAVIDELHTQPDRDLVDAIETSTAARKQPLLVYITTSDFEREGSICNEKEDEAVETCKDPTGGNLRLLPVVYQAENGDDIEKEETWLKANPNLDVSVSRDYIAGKAKKAMKTPTFENTFKRLHLNIRTEQDVRWLSIELWDKCAGKIDYEALKGQPCFIGLDLSATQDTTTMALWFPKQKILTGKIWIPKARAVERERSDHVPYLTWDRQGWITLTPGNVIDYDYIMADVEWAWGQYKVEGLGFDRWQFEAVRQQLIKRGIPEDKMIAFGQGYASMSAPSKELEKKIIGEELIHEGNPVIRWMVSNVNMQSDAAENYKPVKKNTKQRIDFVISAIEAVGIAMTVPEKKQSIYETHGIRAVG